MNKKEFSFYSGVFAISIYFNSDSTFSSLSIKNVTESGKVCLLTSKEKVCRFLEMLTELYNQYKDIDYTINGFTISSTIVLTDPTDKDFYTISLSSDCIESLVYAVNKIYSEYIK